MEQIDPRLVPKRTLNNGEQIPCIGMGTFGSDHVSPEEVSAAVAGAIRCGYRLFDCASVYGNEDQIGLVLEDAMRRAMGQKVRNARQALALSIEKMRGLSPAGKLNQGWAYVEREKDGAPEAVRSIRQAKTDEELRIYVADGVIRAKVLETDREGGAAWQR